MVVEFLTFTVPAERLAAWLEREAEVWTTFLSAQPGFVDKQVWSPGPLDGGDPALVRVVIWWESLEDWKAIGPAEVARVDEAMGDLLITPTCQDFAVV